MALLLLLLLLAGTGGTNAEVRPTRAAAKAMMAALESFMIVTWGGWDGAVGVWMGCGVGSVRWLNLVPWECLSAMSSTPGQTRRTSTCP